MGKDKRRLVVDGEGMVNAQYYVGGDFVKIGRAHV